MTARRRLLALGVLALLLAAGPSLAEVSVVVHQGEYRGFIMMVRMGDDEDPTPFPWRQYRLHVDLAFLLNPYGDGDGPAAPGGATIDPATGFPVVTWSNSEYGWSQHDIAVSEWTGTGWSQPYTLFTTMEDDRDPALVIDATGTRHIVWWRPNLADTALKEVIYARQPADGDPALPSGAHIVGAGIRPSIGLCGDIVRVAYQRRANRTTHVLAASPTPGEWNRETVAQTDYLGPRGDGAIDVRVHSNSTNCWIDWVHDDGLMGFSVFDAASGTWSAPEFEPYSWNAGNGEDEFFARQWARKRIEQRICGPVGRN